MRKRGGGGGSVAAALYRLIAAPLLRLHLQWRLLRGHHHPLQWQQERLGYASVDRPPGPLLWFHAVSVGESMIALPIIQHCISRRPSFHILLTTSTLTSHSLLHQVLPPGILCQFAPIVTASAVERFLTYWHPEAGIFMESELWPNLILMSSKMRMTLALLNARMSNNSFGWWSFHIGRPLVAEMLSSFSLIAPLSTKEAVRFQILGASPNIIHFAGNLKYVVGTVDNMNFDANGATLKTEVSNRCVWIAASTHAGEEEVIGCIHLKLKGKFPNLLTIIAPRHPERGIEITAKLQQKGLVISQRSCGDSVRSETDVYVADTVGELKLMYHLSAIAFVGGSLLKGLAGHNLAEAAHAGCAVLTGPYIGHFSEMVSELQQLSPFSIQQVFGEDELFQRLQELFGNAKHLEIHREAAREASRAAAHGVIQRVWTLLDEYVIRKVFC